MSLFIGKDNNSSKIVHITNSINSSDELKNGIIDSTIFHSSLPYLNVIADFTTNTYRSVVKLPYSIDGGPAYKGKFTMEIPTVAMGYFTQNYLVFIVISSRNSNHIKVNMFRPASGVASTISAQPWYTSSGYAAFTDKIAFNNDGNGYEENISQYPNSKYKFIELAWGNGTFYASEILQGYGRQANIDEIDSTGKLYVINVKNSLYDSLIVNPSGIRIGSSKFFIDGVNTFDMANAKFLERNKTMDEFSFKMDTLVVNPLNLTPSNIVEVDIRSTFGYSEIIKKLDSGLTTPIVNPNSKFIRYVNTLTFSIDSTRSSSGESIISLANISDMAFLLVTFTGTYINGWKNISFIPPFVKIESNEASKKLGAHSVSTTNNQGGFTGCNMTLSISYLGSLASLIYNTAFKHSYFTTNMRLVGTCTILCFK